MIFSRFLAILTLLAALSPALATAQVGQVGHDHAGHGTMATEATEPGQSAFAAIAEVVALPRADPATNWSRVDITALRNHLVNMDDLTLNANVGRNRIPGGMIFTVTGSNRTVGAIRAMVPAHAPYITSSTGWATHVELLDNGATLQVTGDEAQIRALGFFGLMTLGAHHPDHHLAIARGETPH